MPSAPDVVAIPNGVFVENCYLVADAESREAVMVDPGEESPRFLAELKRRGWMLKAIWLTHAHIDHILGVGDVKARTGVPVLLHPADHQMYHGLARQAALFGLPGVADPPPLDGELVEGQKVSIGRFSFDVVHTPGHSPGSVSFLGHGLALSGDVLFAGSIGRTDLPGGSMQVLEQSIRRRLYALPDETRVLSGHGPETTIGVEKRSNPFVRVPVAGNHCMRCGTEVKSKPWGCKNPCPNCGFVYPLGDCSD